MIKVFVFDTNSLISAHLLPQSIARTAFDKALESGILVFSKDTLSEFVQTFTRKKFDKYVTMESRLKAIAQLEARSVLIDVSVKINVCRDPDDNKFLELAATVMADCIITGDKDLLILHPFREIDILSPSGFINRVSK